MIDEAFKFKIEAIIPKGLDDIIRKNREYAQVRHATEEDLALLMDTVPEAYPDMVIKNWHLVTIALLKETGANGPHKITLLLGDILGESGETWITSPVVSLDLDTGYLITHSGTRYMITDKAEGEPSFEQLALLCKRIHRYGSGQVFGVPEFF